MGCDYGRFFFFPLSWLFQVEESLSEKQIKKSPLPSSERKPVKLVRSRSLEKSLDLNENENLPEKSSASDSEEGKFLNNWDL